MTTSDECDKDEGARPSSLRAVHKLVVPDIYYDLQLWRDVVIANEHTRQELRVPGTKRLIDESPKAALSDHPSPESMGDHEPTEDDTMKIGHVAIATALGIAASGASGCTSRDTDGSKGGTVPRAASFPARLDRRYIAPSVKDDVLVMPFYSHDFGSHCFDTLKCRVLYQGRYDTDETEPSEPLTESVRNNLGAGWILDEPPSVATVTWVSKDGTSHEKDIDLGEIFSSGLVRYAPELDVSTVKLSVAPIPPEIVLVVEDRSIRVYMKAWIPLIHPRFPNSPHSNVQEDLVLVRTHRF